MTGISDFLVVHERGHLENEGPEKSGKGYCGLSVRGQEECKKSTFLEQKGWLSSQKVVFDSVLTPFSDLFNSEKLEKAGTVDFKKHPVRKLGTRFRRGRPNVLGRFGFPGARNPIICSISRSGKFFPAIFPGLSRNFPWEPPNRPRKQPQPSRVF